MSEIMAVQPLTDASLGKTESRLLKETMAVLPMVRLRLKGKFGF